MSKMHSQLNEGRIKKLVCLKLFFVIVFVHVVSSCSKAFNYKTAYLNKYQHYYILKLKGKRLLMAHDLNSYLIGKTYTDSVLFNIPSSHILYINGYELDSKPGNYKQAGYIKIDTISKKAWVRLYDVNTDDNKTQANTWNGKYKLLIIK